MSNEKHFQMAMNEKVNLAEKLSHFSEHWAPRTVGGFNGHDLMVVKVLLIEPTGTPNTGDVGTAASRREI